MKKTKEKLLVIVMALLVIMMISGTAAYFTSTDQATNTWKIGRVELALEEPEYDKYNEEEADNMVPNSEVHKDPQAVNVGDNDAFVFMRVQIPKATVAVVDSDDINVSPPEKQELFDYQWNEGWTVLGSRELEDSPVGLAQEYILAYGTADSCTVLKPGETTSVLFKNASGNHLASPNKVGMITFKNLIEGQGLENTQLDMNVEAFAIQADNLTAADTNDPSEVWNIITAQTGA